METVKIKLENCNNIVSANISLEKKALNIKFGYNGTGKTTIGRAIMFKAGDESQLAQLVPYAMEDQEELLPQVDEVPFQKVRVFNEDYSENYLFKQDSSFEDSYKVLLRSQECEKLANEISDLLYGLQNTPIEDVSMGEVLSMLNEYVAVVKYSNGNISRRGGVGEFLKGNGAGFDKYEELRAYRPFYAGKSVTDVTSWANWRTKGIDRMGNEDICPFCADKLNVTEINKKNTTIKKVFKSSALKTAGQIIEYLRNGIEKGYIVEQSEGKLEDYMGDSCRSDELEAELGKLAAETDYLLKKLERIQGFRPMNVTQEQLDNIDESLRQMHIEMDQLSQYYDTIAIRQLAETINKKIDELRINTGKLRGLFKQYDKKMEILIENRKEDINYFFTLAGFPYEFEIRKDGENQASTYLTPVGTNMTSIKKPNSHLSWGEKNAFSLVMFMFDAVSDNADLIVLDDPISSFDINKKFAVIKRLFENKAVSFRGKTVLMLTHDLQPVIDYVHGGFFRQYHIPVKADYIENEKGIIREKTIEDKDLRNIVNLTEQLMKNTSQPLHVRVINYRKYIELTQTNYAETQEYQILSNFVHGRTIPKVKIGSELSQMEEDCLREGMETINNYIEGSYKEIVEELSVEKLLEALDSDDTYSNIIAIRMIFERGEKLLMQLRREYPGACKFLNETNHIENDYVFQLDPCNFFKLPDVYAKELKAFLRKHRSEIESPVNGKDQ